jgi:UDP-N-acetylglucosamine/UDP-N-acetylgalactosamine diphosphorylase
MEVPRAQQFSPLKNGPGEAEDSPDSARRDVMQLHTGWVGF